MKRKLILLLFFGCLASCVVSDGKDQLIETRELTVPLGGAERIVVDVTAGSLEIRGQTRDDVALKAEFWGEVFNAESSQALLKNLSLTHEVADATLKLKTRTREGSLGEDGWINLVLMVPESLPVDVTDRSGDIILSDINADVTIDDSWGDIEVADLSGSLAIDDSSGEIEASHIGGALKVVDTHGDITIKDAGADVSIDDSYGDILVTQVAGNVVVDDGYGDIVVKVVEGDFEVTRNRRGDIEHEDVKGTVTLPQRRRR